ncbi:MAG: PKD domain-containing protein [Paludibacteraceae bacterium]|nr:PKD domain-containing protein [Paludibacteraceae bacterium]
MKKIFTFAAAILASAAMMAAEPTYESYDWASAADMAAGLAGDEAVSIAVVTSGSDGNVSGHWYKALNGAIDGSADNLGTYLSISAASQIDSVEIFFCPNGTNNTNLAWAGWGQGVTPNQEVGTNYGTTASVKSSKSWDNAVWQKIDLSDKEIYTIYISRQGKKLKNNSTIDNFGDNQTVNLLGLRVWLASSTPVTDPVAEVTIAGPTECFVGQKATYTATTDVKATSYQWYIGSDAVEGATSAKFEFTPDAIGSYSISCNASNENNSEAASSNVITLTVTERQALEQVVVTDHTTWDFSKAATVSQIKWEGDQKDAAPVVMANIDGMNNDANFNSQALLFSGEYPIRDGKYCQGPHLEFAINAPGLLTVEYSNTGNRTAEEGESEGQEALRRFLTINGQLVPGDAGSMKSNVNTTTANIAVEPGNVVISGAMPYGADPTAAQYIRIYKVIYQRTGWPTAIDNNEVELKAVKRIVNGQLLIEKNGVMYNAQGVVVK